MRSFVRRRAIVENICNEINGISNIASAVTIGIPGSIWFWRRSGIEYIVYEPYGITDIHIAIGIGITTFKKELRYGDSVMFPGNNIATLVRNQGINPIIVKTRTECKPRFAIIYGTRETITSPADNNPAR